MAKRWYFMVSYGVLVSLLLPMLQWFVVFGGENLHVDFPVHKGIVSWGGSQPNSTPPGTSSM